MPPPAKKGLHNIDKNYTRLENKVADILHFIAANIFWVAKKGRPDIEPTISFLCTRVTNITKEDKEKLRRLLQNLKII